MYCTSLHRITLFANQLSIQIQKFVPRATLPKGKVERILEYARNIEAGQVMSSKTPTAPMAPPAARVVSRGTNALAIADEAVQSHHTLSVAIPNRRIRADC